MFVHLKYLREERSAIAKHCNQTGLYERRQNESIEKQHKQKLNKRYESAYIFLHQEYIVKINT